MANPDRGPQSQGSGFMRDVLRPDPNAPEGVRVTLNGHDLFDVQPKDSVPPTGTRYEEDDLSHLGQE